MNLIRHQFKTDLRHFRWQVLLLWLAFAVEFWLMLTNSLSAEGQGILQMLLTVWQIFNAVLLIAALVQADPLVGTSAAWLTRPVRRRHLFWAKSAFIVLLLLLPRLAAQSAGWMLRGYSFHLWLCAAGQSLMFSLALVLLAAVLASLTRDLARFILAVGITVGGMFGWVVVVETLKRANVIRQAGTGWNERASFDASVLTVAYLVLIAGALLAWVAQARMRWWRASVIGLALGLMAFPLITTCWRFNFLRPHLTSSVPLTASLWTENSRTNDLSVQPLTTELVVAGVPAEHVAVMQSFYASVTLDAKGKQRRLYSTPSEYPLSNSERPLPAESGQKDDYFRVIQKFFPPQTLWFNDNFQNGVISAFASIYNEEVMKRFTNRPPAGSLSGSVELDLFAVKKVAEVPLQRATFNTLPGQRVTIQNVKLTEGVITVSVSESTASLMWNRDLNSAAFNSVNYQRLPVCTYVLYHPGSGEALLVRQDNANPSFPAVLTGETQLYFKLQFPYPALRERFAGVTAAEWLREARLCVFAPVYEGTAKQDFKQEHYQWTGETYRRNDRASVAGFAAIEGATLPVNPTEAQVNSYLDEILLNMPDDLRSEQRDLIGKKLAAIGTNGLPVLLRRLPVSERFESSIVVPAITKLATRDHLPELRAALQRDNEVIQVFMTKHWEADARDVLFARLPDHRAALPAEVLRIVAEAKDPATYVDLRWHFLNLNHGHDQVLPVLEQCPGFDTAALVREAWTRARLGIISTSDLAVAAAKQGLPDALSLVVMGLEGSGDKNRRARELTQIGTLTGYDGPFTNTLEWVSAHLEQFSFDAAQQRYVLPVTR